LLVQDGHGAAARAGNFVAGVLLIFGAAGLARAFLGVVQGYLKGAAAVGAERLARVQVLLGDVNGLAAARAVHLVAGGIGVVLAVLVEVGLQLFHVLAQAVQLALSLGDVLLHGLDAGGHFGQQVAHGVEDFALLGGLIQPKALHQALQVGSF